jgi:hypothetical protein
MCFCQNQVSPYVKQQISSALLRHFDVPVKFDSKFLAARKNSITTYPEKGQDKQAHVSAIAHEV